MLLSTLLFLSVLAYTPELKLGPTASEPVGPTSAFVGPSFSSGDPGAGVSDLQSEHIVEIRIQGNYRTPEDEVRRIAAVQVGDPIDDAAIAALQLRLEKSGKFDDIEVRKRWRTIDSTDDVVLLIVVREVPGGSSSPIGRVARSLAKPLVLPVITWVDGYGLTYGARLSPVRLLGERTHVSIPLTWGATRQAAFEVDRPFTRGPVTQLTASASIRNRENPFYDERETRTMIGARVERTLGPSVRVGLAGSGGDVSFGEEATRTVHGIGSWGPDIAFDTRKSPELPRNAVFVQAGWDRLYVAGSNIDRYRADARGYLGLPWASSLAVRAFRADAASALPAYEQYLLGGAGSVRGFRAGYDAGDSLVLGSVEWRLPLTSPVEFGRLGATVFMDTGAVYGAEEQLEHVRFEKGVGAGLFFNAAIFNLNVDVARGLSRGWHVHVSSGFQF